MSIEDQGALIDALDKLSARARTPYRNILSRRSYTEVEYVTNGYRFTTHFNPKPLPLVFVFVAAAVSTVSLYTLFAIGGAVVSAMGGAVVLMPVAAAGVVFIARQAEFRLFQRRRITVANDGAGHTTVRWAGFPRAYEVSVPQDEVRVRVQNALTHGTLYLTVLDVQICPMWTPRRFSKLGALPQMLPPGLEVDDPCGVHDRSVQ